MRCDQCGRMPAFMHSKTKRFLCRQHIWMDGPGQIQESESLENVSSRFSDFEKQDFTFVGVQNKSGDDEQ